MLRNNNGFVSLVVQKWLAGTARYGCSLLAESLRGGRRTVIHMRCPSLGEVCRALTNTPDGASWTSLLSIAMIITHVATLIIL